MRDYQVSRGTFAKWEARLTAEGLGVLDDSNGSGMRKWETSGSNAVHSGRAKNQGRDVPVSCRVDRRPDKREMDLDSSRQRWRFRTKREREAWRLHCDGIGYQAIAKRLRMSERQVRNLYARIERAQRRSRSVNPAKLRRYIAEADPAIVRKLLAAVSAGDMSQAFERVEEDAELSELYLRDERTHP
jgi:DNA-binding CsgD family transcriptional regulator